MKVRFTFHHLAKKIATIEICEEMLWIKEFLIELRLKQERYVMYCISHSVIHVQKSNISF